MIVIPATEVRLLNNVPLTNTYEHQMDFTSASAQETYFKSKTLHTHSDFTYVKEDGTIKVPRSRDSLYACNYLMFKNTDFSGKWFYAFITKLEYVNPETTKIHFELDVFQTWQFDFTLKPSFVEREHQNRWNADGSPVINTVDEGLNYGTDYKTVKVDQFVPFNDTYFLVIVCKQRMDVNGNEIEPTLNGIIQPLTYYIHPFKLSGGVPSITVDGMNQVLSPVADVLKALYTSTVAVNNIVSLFITEYIGHPSLNFNMSEFEPVNVQDDTGTNFVTLRLASKWGYSSLEQNFGDKYDGFSDVTESKLLMHPYTVTLLSDMKGNVQEIKNEYVGGNDLRVTVKGSIGTSNKVSYNVTDYLIDATVVNGGEVALERALVNNNPNDVPIITDMLSAYLQGNRNSLSNQVNQIQFSSIAGTIGSAFGSVGSAIARNPVGAVSGIADIGMNIANSYFQLEGLLAKQKDLDAVPPSISNLGGNTSFDYGNGITGLYIIKKEITPEYRKKLQDFFKMFGYKLNEVKTPNLRSRTHFNFIKTVGANVTGNVPQDDLALIKKLFDNGITIWHTSDVGNYSLSNGEV